MRASLTDYRLKVNSSISCCSMMFQKAETLRPNTHHITFRVEGCLLGLRFTCTCDLLAPYCQHADCDPIPCTPD